ncbi:hypothetical protein [Pseudobutyrivibrio sp.]
MTKPELTSKIVQNAERRLGKDWADNQEAVLDLISLYTFMHRYNATDFQADKVLEWYFNDIG